ncbi:EXS (ERD1/XPR1/SYG1) family protein isoform X2 [Carex rostrata]
MPEVSLPIPNSSPVIRRTASKSTIFASDDEKFFFEDETIDMKGLSMSTHSAVIVPSLIFLWRFKVLLFLLWGVLCCKVSWDSVMRMSVDLRDLFLYEVFLYYNPLLLITLTVWLWGVNLWVFSQSSVNYARVFDLAQTHLSHREIWKVILYAVILMLLISPFDIFYLSSRYFLLRTFWRIVLPLQAITFADFFLADIMTSMSKVFSDLERSTCRMVNRQVATIAWFEADSICGSHSVAIPMALVFPYLCRFFQCLRQYKDTKEKTCLFNALKYSTAIPVIFLSALKYHVLPENWVGFYRPLWLISSVINSLYSFYWDITRDWDLSILSRIFLFKNPGLLTNLLYGRHWVYYWVLGSNLILRCTWTYKLSAHLRHNYLTVFAITALEIVRRFQWVFFRVENEWNKMTQKQILELTEAVKEEERLLGSAGHNV